jgi:hypothetical protein
MAAMSAKRENALAMSYTFGKPAFWITWSPNFGNSITLWQLANGSRPGTPPPVGLRFKLIANNPGAMALEMERIMEVLVEVVFNWDSDAKAPKKVRCPLLSSPWFWFVMFVLCAFYDLYQRPSYHSLS